MTGIEAKLREIVFLEEVNTKLWSCSVILLVETSSEFSDYPTLFTRHASVTRRPILQCLSLSKIATETARTSIKLETMSKEWPTIYNRLKASGCIEGVAKETKINLERAFGRGAAKQAASVKIFLLKMREQMMDAILGASDMMGRKHLHRLLAVKRNLRPREQRAIVRTAYEEEEGDTSPIGDQPKIGPHLYLILTDFYDPRIFFNMVRMKIPITSITALGGDPALIRPRNIFGEGEAITSQFNFDHFWAHYNFEMLDLTKALACKDVAVVLFDPVKEVERTEQSQKQNLAEMTESTENIIAQFPAALVQAIYDCTIQMRNYLHYIRKTVTMKVPKLPASRADFGSSVFGAYRSLVDLLPWEMITVEYMLHCMVEHISISLTADSDVDLLPQGSSPLWQPEPRERRLQCRPLLLHCKDVVTQLFLPVKSQLPFDLGVIHANIHCHMPYALLWNKIIPVKCDRIKQSGHMYKLWRCSESSLPFQTFQEHFNLVIFSKFYNTVVEPIRHAQLEILFRFIFLRSGIVTFDPKMFRTDQLQNESLKLREFVQCLEILNSFDFPPIENEPMTSYNAFDELEPLVCLQCLQKAFCSYNDVFYTYFPPTDRILIWFHNDIASDELNSYSKKGVLATPVGFSDFFKFTKEEEHRWLSEEKVAMAEQDAKVREAYLKEIDAIKVRNDKDTNQEAQSYQIPLNYDPGLEMSNSKSQKVLYDVQKLQMENKEQVTEFVTAEGTAVKAKVHKWVYGSDRVLSLVMNCDGTTLAHHRIIEDRLKNKGSDDAKIGITMISPEKDVFVKYDVTTTFTVVDGGGEEVRRKKQAGAVKDTETGSITNPKVKKKSITGEGKRMSVKKKSITGGGGKRMSVKKKSIAGGGGKRMSVKKKSIAGGGGKRMSVKKKSTAGDGEKRQSMKKRLTMSPGSKKRGSSVKETHGREREPKVVETTEFELKVTTGSGLKITCPIIENIRVVKQEFLREFTTEGVQLEERYRIYLPDGGVLIYKDDGTIVLLHPNSTITRIKQINRVVSTVLKDSSELGQTKDSKALAQKSGGPRMSRVSGQSRKSMGKKSITGGEGKRMSVKKKSIAEGGGKRMSVKKKSVAGGGGKRMSVKKKSIAGGKRLSVKKKSIAGGEGKRQSMRKSLGGKRQSIRKSLGGDRVSSVKKSSKLIPVEVVSYDVAKHEVVDHYGKQTYYVNNVPENSEESLKIRVGQESSGRIYVKRTDGSNSYYKDDGVLHVKYPDGTLITSEPVEETPIFGEDELNKGRLLEEEHEEESDFNGYTTWKLKHTLEHPKYARVEWRNATPTVIVQNNTSVTPGETTSFCVQMNGVKANFNQNEASVLTFDPRNHEKITTSKFSFPLLRHQTDPGSILETVDSWGRSFQVSSEGTINYAWPEPSNIRESSGPVYDVSRFNKFFIVDRSFSGLELVQETETNEIHQTKLLIKPKTYFFHPNQINQTYSFKDIRPAEMTVKELTRYLVFPRQQWLFNLPTTMDGCVDFPCRPVDRAPRVEQQPTAVLFETIFTISRYDIVKQFQDAVHSYTTFHEIIFKKYLTYLNELEGAVRIKSPFVISNDPAEGIVGKYLAVENSFEKEKFLTSDRCFNKGDTIFRCYLKPLVRQEEKITNKLNF